MAGKCAAVVYDDGTRAGTEDGWKTYVQKKAALAEEESDSVPES